tara:strand:+ start:553 stop:1554 length:1002 start_codon:yes stop_codon:yes gene_type:complete
MNLKKKRILITGGTGSFGKNVLKRLLKENISEARIFSRDEKKQFDLRNSINDKRVSFYIGDIRDISSLENSLKNIDMVFHAAALKQVPSCEFFPYEAVQTNIIGAKNLISLSIKNNIKKVIFLSTDKAVYPINAMGMTKALMEKLVFAASKNVKKTIFCVTRYGNVMMSRGSVIPLFVDQIKNKKNITITDPNMTRFLMSLEESVDLVLHALKFGKQGDLFIQKSPATNILTLAKAIKNIFNSKVKIKIIGTRLGEKKHETLISKEEMIRSEDQKKYYRIIIEDNNNSFSPYYTKGLTKITANEDYTSFNTTQLDRQKTIKLLKKIDLTKTND